MASKASLNQKSIQSMKDSLRRLMLTNRPVTINKKEKDDNLFSSDLLSRFFEYDRKTVVNLMLLEAFIAKNENVDAAGIKAAFEEFEPLAEKIAKQYEACRDAERERDQKNMLTKAVSVPMSVSPSSSPQMRIPANK